MLPNEMEAEGSHKLDHNRVFYTIMMKLILSYLTLIFCYTIGLYFVELFFVILELCSHDPIPKAEVETIITIELLMVEVVVNRRIDDFKYPRLSYPKRHDLESKMTVYIDDKGRYGESQERQRVDR